jgi:hypothetical protein
MFILIPKLTPSTFQFHFYKKFEFYWTKMLREHPKYKNWESLEIFKK